MGEASRRAGPGTAQEKFERRREIAISEGRAKVKKTTTDGMTHRTIPLPSVNTPGKSSLKWGAGSGISMRRAIPTSPLQGTVDATGSRSDDLLKIQDSDPDTPQAPSLCSSMKTSAQESVLGAEC